GKVRGTFLEMFYNHHGNGLWARSSLTISAAAARARSPWSGGKEMAPTRACPPPPYRSQICARFTISSGRALVHGFEPTATLVRKLDLLRPTLYVASGCRK